MVEIYKDVIGYEGIYQISNLGNVKSFKWNKEKILTASGNSKGYCILGLSKNGIVEMKKVHQLVAESFLNHKRCGMKLVVNHIDFDKTNNKLDNLEIVTTRENTNQKHLKSYSNFTGVSWNKRVNKWIASIKINNKSKYLGYYNDELEASKAYQKELLNIS
jgi:hypothetical protein